MLRAATPLAVVLFIAFALELLAVISTPIVKAIPLATFQGVEYGVFGFCKGNACTPIRIGYPSSNNNDDSDFTLPANARRSLSSLLVVHPIAALLTLICAILAITAHWHSPAHSSRFLLGMVIFMVPTFLVSLLAFLVDILLFVPHLGWGGWIILAATILIVLCGVLTCAMRRTLVSRKARKQRIAENAEMSGENFYVRQGAVATAPSAITAPSSVPASTTANGSADPNTLPSFATFDRKERPSEDDRTPLNSRTATGISNGSGPHRQPSDEGMDRYRNGAYGSPPRGNGGYRGRGRGGIGYGGPPPRDEYGNPLPGYGRGPASRDGYGPMPSRPSNEMMRRGRGGYGPPPRGYGRGGPYRGRGGPPMGGPYGRGGPRMGPGPGPRPPPGYGYDHGPPGSSGAGPYGGHYADADPYGPPNGYARGPPPEASGYGGDHHGLGTAGAVGAGALVGAAGAAAMDHHHRQASPAQAAQNYQQHGSSPPPQTMPGYEHQGSAPPLQTADGYPPHTSPSPPHQAMDTTNHVDPDAIGQAVAMDETTGSPSQTPGLTPPQLSHEFDPSAPAVPHETVIRDSDSDVRGLVGLQEGRLGPGGTMLPSTTSPSSEYSSQREVSYVPARSAWNDHAARGASPLGAIQASPTEARQNGGPGSVPSSPTKARVGSSENYYEDVDPRFAQDPVADEPSYVAHQGGMPHATGPLPTVLVPGGGGHGNAGGMTNGFSHEHSAPDGYTHDGNGPALHNAASYDSSMMMTAPDANHSLSDVSQMSSISQRPVNPHWQGPPGSRHGGGGGTGNVGGMNGAGGNGGAMPAPLQPHGGPPRERDYLLANNPDFAVGSAQSGAISRDGGGYAAANML